MFKKLRLTVFFCIVLMANYVFADTDIEQAKSNIISLIQQSNYAGAQVQTQNLIAGFPGHPDLPETLYWIAEEYHWSAKFAQSKDLHQQIIQNFSGSLYADKAQLAYSRTNVISLIASNKLEQAEEALDKLVADFSGHPDLPEALYWIAEEYRWSGKHDKAKDLQQHIIQNFSGSPYADKAQMSYSRTEVLSLIDSNKLEQAKEALDKLVTDFSGHPDLPETLYWIAGGYKWSGRYEQAKSVYQQVIQSNPDSSWAGKAKLGLSMTDVLSLIASGEYSQSEEALDKLVADFPGHPDLPEVLNRIAEGYEWSGRYEQAERVYQQVIQNHPDSSRVGDAKLGISSTDVISLIISGSYSQAEKAIDKLAADYSGHPDLPGVLSNFVAERLYDKAFELDSAGLENQSKAYFQKAVDIWEQVSATQPKLTHTADGYNWAGNCYRKLGQYTKAIECYKSVAENFPDYELAWNCLFRVGRCYEDMAKAGLISAEQAEPEIRAAYQQLIEEYPNCKAVRIAKDWLYENQQEAEDTIYEE
jgi:tetratricopeptide (TPR) repeat protein